LAIAIDRALLNGWVLFHVLFHDFVHESIVNVIVAVATVIDWRTWPRWCVGQVPSFRNGKIVGWFILRPVAVLGYIMKTIGIFYCID
jgi:hypothetical protein